MNEFMECVPELDLKSPDISINVIFDEFNLNIEIEYVGKKLLLRDTKPTKESIISEEEGSTSLAGYLIHHISDDVKITSKNMKELVIIHFDH